MGLSDIIDNRESAHFAERLRRFLVNSQAAHFAVGYFFLSGFAEIADELARLAEVRLLIGNISDRETVEQLAEGYQHLALVKDSIEAQTYRTQLEMLEVRQATAAALRAGVDQLDQTEKLERAAQLLIELIQSGRLQVRVYTRGRLHAKAYIFDYGAVYDATGAPIERDETGVAVVGSSNLSLAGIQHSTELNVVVRGNANHAALKEWYQALWNEAQEFDQDLMHILRESWAGGLARPYDIYMKALYSLVEDRIDGQQKKPPLWTDELTDKLTEFQKVAVKQAVAMIRQYGGAFVSDVVGLGKSYVGAAILKHFAWAEWSRALIVCPASLVKMWERYNRQFWLNAQVLSMGNLRENGDVTWLRRTYEQQVDLVLIDESHNFRHTDTQRYRVLQELTAQGKRVCLLTATPRNQSVWDIYSQIKLFHPHDTTQLPVQPANLREYFKLIEIGERTLQELLQHILVRRTRLHVLRWYGYDAETNQRIDPNNFEPYLRGERRAYVCVNDRKQFFPQRQLETVDYSIEATYHGLYDQLRGYIGHGRTEISAELPDELVYARYGLWWYVRQEKRLQKPYVDLQTAGANLRGLMRIMLFKRFESSVYAFRETVKRMVKVHRLFLEAMAKGHVPAGEEAQQLLYESDLEDEVALMQALEAVSGLYDINDFEVERLQAHLQHDLAILEKILELVEPIRPEQDAKLQTLKALLEKPALRDKKRLIFTQYADTARYLYEQLNPKSDRAIEVIYSNNRDKSAIIGRFAPKANPESAGTPEVHTLIATDVLSEGLNLQDCNIIINYDLHWNPVRLIQRFGRVDRIGTEHDVVYGYNFLPETGIEHNLGLHDRLARRIQEIHETIGEDTAILERSERLNPEAFYAIYERRIGAISEEELDETEFLSLSEAEEMFRQMREQNSAEFERIRSLRNGIRSAMPEGGKRGVFVLCRSGRYKRAYVVEPSGEIVAKDVSEVLKLLHCTPNTPTGELPSGYSELVMRVKRQFEAEVKQREQEQSHRTRQTVGQRYALDQLRLLMQSSSGEKREQIQLLEKFLRETSTAGLNRELNRLRQGAVSGNALFESLIKLYHQYGVNNRAEQPTSEQIMQEKRENFPIIICSEAL
ncbi:MAG: helicase [Candidatus Thermofonsia Clade 1 bacterium]|uniref:Helicase n=1 Tax=Candidatus Thermofonsia Clade 1 bacterium TaxID=2364210 RepID=A0A2M8NZ96_9CHLR|nr:MAG: helicase [Candidatus Thermofonsia Clade 1 bacterium]